MAIPIFLIGAFSLIAFLDKWFFVPYILVWFRYQYLLVLLACAPAAALLRNWMLFGLCLVLSIPNAMALVPYFLPGARSEKTQGQHLRICQINVNYANPQYDRTISYIKRCNPDLILIEEMTDGWAHAIEEAFPEYRSSTKEARPDPFGIGTFSRLPITRQEVKHYGGLNFPTAISWIRWNDIDLKVTHLHLLPATSRHLLDAQRRQFVELINDARSRHEAQVIAGDFNAPIWSSFMRELLSAANLHSSANGFGWKATWPQNEYALAMLGIPLPGEIIRVVIDHCLVSDQFTATSFSVGGDVGSDHFPLCVEIQRSN